MKTSMCIITRNLKFMISYDKQVKLEELRKLQTVIVEAHKVFRQNRVNSSYAR